MVEADAAACGPWPARCTPAAACSPASYGPQAPIFGAQPLPGYPVKLRVRTKLRFKNPKQTAAVFVSNTVSVSATHPCQPSLFLFKACGIEKIRKLDRRRHRQLAEHPRTMNFDGSRADEQRRSDLLVGLAVRR